MLSPSAKTLITVLKPPDIVVKLSPPSEETFKIPPATYILSLFTQISLILPKPPLVLLKLSPPSVDLAKPELVPTNKLEL